VTIDDLLDFSYAQLAKLRTSRSATCHNCAHKTAVPLFFEEYCCENCGATVNTGKLPRFARFVRKVLEWAKADTYHIGLGIGSSSRVPAILKQKLKQESNNRVKFIRLDNVFKWRCQHCGACCKLPFKTKQHNMARLSKEEATLLFGDTTQTRLPTDPETGYCIFFDPTTKNCTVHDKRPMFCRLFPFGSIGVEKQSKYTRYLFWTGSPCPGLNKGDDKTLEEFLLSSGVLHRMLEDRDTSWIHQESDDAHE